MSRASVTHLEIILTGFYRRPLWLLSLTRESSSEQIVGRLQEATSYVFNDCIEDLWLNKINSQKANRVTDKLTHVHDRVYCCRSGSAADTQAVADIVHYYLQMYAYVALFLLSSDFALHDRILHRSSQEFGTPPPVHTAASLFQKLCYDNKDNLSAGIIVAGWDKERGPSVYNIPLGGGLFRQPWAIGGAVLHQCLVVVLFFADSTTSRVRFYVCLRLLRRYIQRRLGTSRNRPVRKEQ
jgi:hypothetical protein